MTTRNRIYQAQPDYLLAIVRRPHGWKPDSLDAVPGNAEVLTTAPVASYEEAHDDVLRCNRLALKNGLDRWAIIQAPSAGL